MDFNVFRFALKSATFSKWHGFGLDCYFPSSSICCECICSKWAYMYKHTYIFKKKRTDSKQITKHQRNEINFGYKKKLIYTKVNCILWDIVLVNMCVFVNIISQKVYLCCLSMCLNRADTTEEAPNHILLYFIIRTL